jgi:DNA-directed RNA polymerase specialized sigma subunit
VIQHRVNQFSGVPIPRVAIEAEAKKQAVFAMGTYNPKKGASLKTHVQNRMPKVFRYVARRQNVGAIPEHRVAKINTFKKTKEYLWESKGREPSTTEMADELKWSPQEIARMESELRKDLGHSLSFQDTAFEDFNQNMETINFAYYKMTPREQLVYDYSIGAHGKERMTTTNIAKKLGVSPSQISKIKGKIVKMIDKHMV